MKILDFAEPERSDWRLGRVAAVTFIGAAVIAVLYFGQEVLVPTAIAVLLAFILGPAVAVVRRLLPLSLAVAAVVLGALVVAALITTLIMNQLAEVAGSLTGYQANLHQKIQDIRHLSEGGGALSRFASMVASLGRDLAVTAEPSAAPAVRVQSGSDFASVAAFVAPLMGPLLTLVIVVILTAFILLDRDHLSDKFVRLFGASDVHATSEAIGDAATRIGRVLSLQLLTNFGFAVLVGGGLFALGMPNPVLWGLLAGGLRFIPYVGAMLGAVLPTLIAFAVAPGWLQPFLVLGWIVGGDIVIGQIVEPLLFGESTGVTPTGTHLIGDLLGYAVGARRPVAVDANHHLLAGAGHARAASWLPADPAGRRAGAGALSTDLSPPDPQSSGRCFNGGAGRDRREGV
jgi:predicted PurR-regulated permease PerM